MPIVAGIFSDRDATESGLSELYQEGYGKDQIGVIWRDRSYSEPVDEFEYRERHYADEHGDVAEEAGKGAAGGAVGGAAVGAGTVLFASAGLALIPGIGALLAAGTAAATLAGAAAGAVGGGVTGGIVGALIGAGDEDGDVTEVQTRYRDAMSGDGFVVTIDTDSPEDAADALRDAGAEQVTVIEEADYYR
jgi:hypothetical protein